MDTYEEFIDFVMNDVSDEQITNLFDEMGIEIDLNKPWVEDDAGLDTNGTFSVLDQKGNPIDTFEESGL